MIRKEGVIYLTVKEFAEAAAISSQAAYKQLQTRLKDYSLEVENQTYINAAALDKFYGSEAATQVEQVVQPWVESDKLLELERSKVASLEEMVNFLKNEIQEKNKQIENLSLRLQEAIKSVDQEQQLHLVTQQKLLLIEKQEEEAAAEEEKAAAAAESKKHWWNIRRKKNEDNN